MAYLDIYQGYSYDNDVSILIVNGNDKYGIWKAVKPVLVPETTEGEAVYSVLEL